ncbi:MAG: TM2 domain-containing protein, partial [Olsenella sp.]
MHNHRRHPLWPAALQDGQAQPDAVRRDGELGASLAPSSSLTGERKSKIAAGLLAIFLGGLGIHKFYLGFTKAGVITLCITLLGSFATMGIAALVMEVIALI